MQPIRGRLPFELPALVASALAYWRSKIPAPADAPEMSNMDLSELPEICAQLILLEVCGGSPPRFRFAFIGDEAAAAQEDALEGKLIGEVFPVAALANLEEQCLEVVRAGRPSYVMVNKRLGRLVAPLLRDESIAGLLVAAG